MAIAALRKGDLFGSAYIQLKPRIMKHTFLFSAFFATAFQSFAQCSDCQSLSEALKDPARVQHLDLSSQALTEVPKELALFTRLQTLDLSDNRIVTPEFYGTFEQLHHLNISDNPGLDPWKLDGIGKAFPHLTRLEMAGCKLPLLPTGMDRLKELTVLDVSNNALAFVPQELEQASRLCVLDLSGNQLTDVRYVLGTLWNLSHLDLSENPSLRLTGVLQSLQLNKKLEALGIDGTLVDKTAEKLLRELPVTTLELHGLKDDKLPNGVAQSTVIEKLTLTNAQPDNTVSAQLAKMQKLTSLTLDNSSIPAQLEKAANIDVLTIRSESPVPVNQLAGMSKLERLDLIQTETSAEELKTLATRLPQTMIVSATASTTPDFTRNNVAAIVPLEVIRHEIPGDAPSQVTVSDVDFDIPAQAFLLPDGQLYTGTVELAVKVYDNALDIALDGAPMTYTENGRDEIFSSSGMVDVRAYAEDGQELQANPDNLITMTMPERLPGDESDLFFYNETLNSWYKSNTDRTTPAYIDSVIASKIDSLNQLALSDYVNYQAIPRLYAMKVKKRRWDPSELSFTSYRPSSRMFSDRKNRKQILQYTVDREGKLIDRTPWRIDTLMTDELVSLMKEIRKSYFIPENINGRVQRDYNAGARIIRDLHIQPDFANDNYRMTFLYRDSLVSLPVYIDSQGKNRRIMHKHAKLQRSLDLAVRKDKKDIRLANRRKDMLVARYAEQNRAEAIMQIQRQLAGNPLPGRPQQARISGTIITLLSLGLVNCDRFYRPAEQPDYYKLDNVLTDQEGNEYQRPETVRAVYQNANTYFTVNSAAMPDYKNEKTIVIIPLSQTHIGVIRLEGKKTIGKVKSINIEGKTNAEVQQLIQS